MTQRILTAPLLPKEIFMLKTSDFYSLANISIDALQVKMGILGHQNDSAQNIEVY